MFFLLAESANALDSKTLANLCRSYAANNFKGGNHDDFACVSYFLGYIDASNSACTYLGIMEQINRDPYTELKLKQLKESLGSSYNPNLDVIIGDFLKWFDENPKTAHLPPHIGRTEWLTKKWPCN